jgi:hypothetical protein
MATPQLKGSEMADLMQKKLEELLQPKAPDAIQLETIHKLLLAISTGLLQHLDTNQGAFSITGVAPAEQIAIAIKPDA